MPLVSFSEMPDSARIWIFASPEPVGDSTRERLLESVREHISGWLAHGRPVYGAMDWRYDQFLIIAADEAASGVSGCSIDSLFRTLRTLEEETGVTLLDASRVWHRDDEGRVKAVSRPEFRRLAREGMVTEGTFVFDNTAPTVGALRSGEWERPAGESWHGKAFMAAGG